MYPNLRLDFIFYHIHLISRNLYELQTARIESVLVFTMKPHGHEKNPGLPYQKSDFYVPL